MSQNIASQAAPTVTAMNTENDQDECFPNIIEHPEMDRILRTMAAEFLESVKAEGHVVENDAEAIAWYMSEFRNTFLDTLRTLSTTNAPIEGTTLAIRGAPEPAASEQDSDAKEGQYRLRTAGSIANGCFDRELDRSIVLWSDRVEGAQASLRRIGHAHNTAVNKHSAIVLAAIVRDGDSSAAEYPSVVSRAKDLRDTREMLEQCHKDLQLYVDYVSHLKFTKQQREEGVAAKKQT
ncbi:unnamed protein product [Zymoseptoria tritici ST99CH_3D7]|uniref:Uncharacterized protein n=1 Tax=Zymoseptoria tritici (strain ST99CH_3D7) TaxID=1276538 RepID=A0A1X7S961_ZYMT9|nr:unnamed protein product [Zymoseptoria tritici ST99CH_3D7]